MTEVTEEFGALSKTVFDAAREAAFALMQANYTEKDAPELGPEAKIKGLEGQARDLAIRFRESIWYRFDALRFHYEILLKVHDGYLNALVDAGPLAMRDRESFDLAYSAVLREQAIFDDLVFHAISLFDYLGNAVWFGFHGQNHVKRKWKNAVKAARNADFETADGNDGRRIHGSETGDLIACLDREFVNKLAEYRASLFHYHGDPAGGGVTYNFKGKPGEEGGDYWPELRIRLPNDYANSVQALVGGGADNEEDETLLLEGAEVLIRKVGETTLRLLETLTEDLGWDKDAGLVILS